jgi:radical SAM protein with 4Fe4S-binding SPASM domain
MSQPALEITGKIGCSNWCKCCPQLKLISTYSDSKKTLSLEDFKIILNHVPKNVMILFSGFCEIFLNQHAIDLILYSIDSGYPTCLYTTLIGSNEDDYKKLSKRQLVDCVIHAPDDKYFVYNYSKWKEKYSLFKQYRIPHKLMALGPTNVVGTTIHNPHSRAGNLNDINSNYVKGKIGCSVSNLQKLDNNIVLPNGDVYLCCMDYSLENKLGNLLEERWEDIHSNINYQWIVKLMNEENSDIICRKCHAVVKI